MHPTFQSISSSTRRKQLSRINQSYLCVILQIVTQGQFAVLGHFLSHFLPATTKATFTVPAGALKVFQMPPLAICLAPRAKRWLELKTRSRKSIFSVRLCKDAVNTFSTFKAACRLNRRQAGVVVINKWAIRNRTWVYWVAVGFTECKYQKRKWHALKPDQVDICASLSLLLSLYHCGDFGLASAQAFPRSPPSLCWAKGAFPLMQLSLCLCVREKWEEDAKERWMQIGKRISTEFLRIVEKFSHDMNVSVHY